ncbi:MAG: hypothetical protein GXP55_12685 [Deltaproteobacteria bacterium]|nr:hypothetical protein [Deltaproteobacteria bacterium]
MAFRLVVTDAIREDAIRFCQRFCLCRPGRVHGATLVSEMHMSYRGLAALSLLSASLAACSSAHTAPAMDAALDAGDVCIATCTDAAPDATRRDAAVDAGPRDATADASDSGPACGPSERIAPPACARLRPEGTPVAVAERRFIASIQTRSGPVWLYGRSAGLEPAVYNILRPSEDYESYEPTPVAGLPVVRESRAYADIVNASGYLPDCDSWLFLLHPHDALPSATYARVYGADGRPRNEPVRISDTRIYGPVSVAREGFSVLDYRAHRSPTFDVTIRRIDISSQGELLGSTPPRTAPVASVAAWTETRKIFVTSTPEATSLILRSLFLSDFADDGSLTHARSLSDLGEDLVSRWRFFIPETGPGLLLYVSPSGTAIRAQRFDVATARPLGSPFTIFQAPVGSGVRLGGSRGRVVPGVGYAWPVTEVRSIAGGVWLTQFSGDGSHVEQRLLRSGMITATPASSLFWTGDRYIVQWSTGGRNEFDDLSCID